MSSLVDRELRIIRMAPATLVWHPFWVPGACPVTGGFALLRAAQPPAIICEPSGFNRSRANVARHPWWAATTKNEIHGDSRRRLRLESPGLIASKRTSNVLNRSARSSYCWLTRHLIIKTSKANI